MNTLTLKKRMKAGLELAAWPFRILLGVGFFLVLAVSGVAVALYAILVVMLDENP